MDDERTLFITFVGDGTRTMSLDRGEKSYEEQISRHLSLMNGSDRSAYVLWPGQPGIKPLDLYDDDVQPVTFLQAAGTAERMSIEWKAECDGTLRQYVLGRVADHEGEPTDQVAFNDGTSVLEVYDDEVFAHAEAVRIFTYYTAHHAPPPEYTSREIHLEPEPDSDNKAP